MLNILTEFYTYASRTDYHQTFTSVTGKRLGFSPGTSQMYAHMK